MMTRGYRNNNPLNIRKSRDTFRGESVPSTDYSFKQFESMEYGYRAAFCILATYLDKGINTIGAIISRWAPEKENNTESYIKFVEKTSGIGRQIQLNRKGGKEFCKIVAAMSFYENGVEADEKQVSNGFLLQEEIK